MLEYCEVGVGNVRNLAGGYWAAADDLKASGRLKGIRKKNVSPDAQAAS